MTPVVSVRYEPQLAPCPITRAVDCGDYIIVTNAKKIKVTGKKEEQLVYRKHTMFPGGLKETPYKTMQERKPDEVRQKPLSEFSALICSSLCVDYSPRSVGHVTEEQTA